MNRLLLKINSDLFIDLFKAVSPSTYEHPDKLGAGAAKRRKLKNPDDKFEAVMHEFKEGTLHDSSGAIVRERKRALAIAGSESGKYMKIRKREDGNRSVPKEYEGVEKEEFADSTNMKYPLDNEEHVRAAISYLAMPRNYEKYSKEERTTIARKICQAARKYDIEVSDEWREKFGLQSMQKAISFEDLIKATQLEIGTKIESEHKETFDFIRKYLKENEKLPPEEEVYKHIAENHLDEFKTYYTALIAMEKKLKEENMQKAKNYIKLVKKVITDKNGHKKTVYINPNPDEKDLKKKSSLQFSKDGALLNNENKVMRITSSITADHVIEKYKQDLNIDLEKKEDESGKFILVKKDNKQNNKSKDNPEDKNEDKDKQKKQESSSVQIKFKESIRKIANILAEALSGKDPTHRAGEAVEQAGENVSRTGKLNKEPQKTWKKSTSKTEK